MTPRADSRMVLVVVRQVDDVELARALAEAIADEIPVYLLFTQEELRDRFGEPRWPHGIDSMLCMLNPQHFGLVVSFWGARDPSPSSNALLLSCFNEIGVPTLEIQHGLFQDHAVEPVGLLGDSLAGTATLRRGCAARGYLRWDGPDGIGYLKSELARARAVQQRDLILITSQLEVPTYSEKQRYQFAIAVSKLAMAHPELRFVWPVRPAELAHGEVKRLLGMVQEYAISNLTLEKGEPAEAWVGRCRLGISTPATALLEYQLAERPALVHLGAVPKESTARFSAHGFCSYFELERVFRRALEAPAEFLIDTGVGRLNRDHLREQIARAMRSGELAADWLPAALRYIGYMREGRGTRAEINKLAASLASLERKLASFEALFGGLDKSIAQLDGALGGVAKELMGQRGRLTGIADRVNLLQRSTFGYKARKIVARWRGKNGGDTAD